MGSIPTLTAKFTPSTDFRLSSVERIGPQEPKLGGVAKQNAQVERSLKGGPEHAPPGQRWFEVAVDDASCASPLNQFVRSNPERSGIGFISQ